MMKRILILLLFIIPFSYIQGVDYYYYASAKGFLSAVLWCDGPDQSLLLSQEEVKSFLQSRVENSKRVISWGSENSDEAKQERRLLSNQ